MFLVDTNVLAELRKGARCDPHVARWSGRHPTSAMWISVITLGEIRKGVELVRPRDPSQAAALEAWLLRVTGAFSGRTLALDATVADAWGRMNARSQLPAIDGLLAATASAHGLVLATRNVRDFARAGVALVNPFEPEP
ncbi:MAG: type II toxin-antitoxin system VapC family toxin [Polyangiales bacterium]